MEDKKKKHNCLSCGVQVPKGVLFCSLCLIVEESTLDEEADLEVKLLLNPSGRVQPRFDSEYN